MIIFRNYKLDKETTQRLLDLAVEDNLIKLHKKVGTKGNKAGVEEDAYRYKLKTRLIKKLILQNYLALYCVKGL